MKMINAGTANIADFPAFVYNCNTMGTCRRTYIVPLPTISDLQLYVYFGSLKPVTFEFTVFNRCQYGESSIVESGCFIIANNGEGWYGVFKQFSPALTYPNFVVALKVTYENETTGTFFSEEYSQLSPCDKLTKIEVCYPVNYNAEDPNGIYIGQPSEDFEIIGNPLVFYNHRYWVRDAEVVELQNKLTFVSNSKKNFSTTINKIFEFRTELVPGWYKDYLLAVYFRGNFSINGISTKASEFSGENVLEDADLWKPYVKIDKELKGAFGCAPIDCIDQCTCYPVELPAFELTGANIGYHYSKVVAILGTPAFTLEVTSKPEWMTISITGGNLSFTGTPTAEGEFEASFKITNLCGEIEVVKEFEVGNIPCVGVTFPEFTLPAAQVGVVYNQLIPLEGTPPFVLSSIVKPAWMTVAVVGDEVQVTGTPTEDGEISLSFTVSNCGDNSADFEQSFMVNPPCQEYYNNTSGNLEGINYISCNGTEFINQTVTPGQSICIQAGSGSGGDFGFMIYLGTCP